MTSLFYNHKSELHKQFNGGMVASKGKLQGRKKNQLISKIIFPLNGKIVLDASYYFFLSSLAFYSH